MTLGEKLSEKRRAKGFTQDDVAEKLGVTPQAVSKWENDASCPDISLLPTLASLYETTIDELLSKESAPAVSYLPPEKRKNFNDMVFRILVQDGGDKVKVNLPMPLVKFALETGIQLGGMNINVGDTDLSKIDFGALIQMVENGLIGRLVEIEGEDGESVIIEVS
ncbi:MAG: helix-turn-helix transcriptional regulator [Clostridia bacterium]|nr:helix-turn-helix transcriptional regulator [Clostridia bacterium]MBQ8334043.1 helix-turn-helix transcriptional regulator [Clostridia bacterium]MBQ8370652.1 helix-turn-helix transcriptional regulator [Clostridia bacterium]MBQ8512362.1 helix-turn-helix transcriptional regulator [Clostridia bacterium]